MSPVTPVAPLEAEMPKEAPSAPKPKPDRVRKKLDLTQNKRGAFSILVGTLSRAKQEDKERAASDSVCSSPDSLAWAFSLMSNR